MNHTISRDSDVSNVSHLSSIDLESEPSVSGQFESFPKMEPSPIPPNYPPPQVSHLPLIAMGILLGGSGWLCWYHEQDRIYNTALWYWCLVTIVVYSVMVCHAAMAHWYKSCYPDWYGYLNGLVLGVSGLTIVLVTPHPDWHNLLFWWALVNAGGHLSYMLYGRLQWCRGYCQWARQPPIQHPQQDPFSSDQSLTPV